jgi:pimeloyl-ACP methyl ester carboxylesterase
VAKRALLLLLALPFFAGSADAATRPALTSPRACPDSPGFTCMTLAVPLDHSGHTRGALKLQVAVQDVAPTLGVLVFLTGGPGQPGAPFAGRVQQRLGGVFDGYRLVLIDQRGTGELALQCPALQRRMGSSDLAVPTRGEVVGCASAIGAKRRFFGTDQTVQDLDWLRRALGEKKLTLDGVSYGTFVAERYAIRYPKNTARLVLDSVVPHEGLDALRLESAPAAGRVLRLLCRERRCAGDPAADLAAVVTQRPSIAAGLLDALVTMSVIDPTYPGVPEALRAARAGSRVALDTLIATYRPDPSTPAEALSQGLHASALCADNPMPWGGPATPLAARGRALQRAVATLKPRALWPFGRNIASGNGIIKTCLYWPPEPAPTVPRGKLPAVPVLLLGGDHDLSTPLGWARQELAKAPKGKLVVVPGAGHSTQLRAVSEVARTAVSDFLHQARTTYGVKGDGCATGAKPISFRASDGVKLHGVLLGSGRKGIVLAHEFRATLCNWFPFAQTLAARGYRVLAYDSRVVSPTAGHLEYDTLGAVRELLRRGVKRVIVGGASAGGDAAMGAAAKIPRATLAGLVVLSSPGLFASIDAFAAVRRVAAPSFFGVGSKDTAFTGDVRKLYADSAAKRKELVVVQSSGHGTQLLDTSWAPASFRTRLLVFIAAAFRR